MGWFQSIAENALWTILTGWTGLVPFEIWWVVAAVVALMVLRATGPLGVAVLSAVVAYVLGVMRGRDMRQPPKPPAANLSSERQQRPTPIKDIFQGIFKR